MSPLLAGLEVLAYVQKKKLLPRLDIKPISLFCLVSFLVTVPT